MNVGYLGAIISFMISIFFMAAAISGHYPYSAIPTLVLAIAFLIIGFIKNHNKS